MFQLLLMVIYLAFISLGLPDALLGSAWPTMYPQFGVPVSYAGMLSMIIAAGTILSSLCSDRLTRKLGAGKVTAVSVLMTAAALLGFSCSGSFWMLCLWAIPYGLGAGSVDAALNNYVALHYASRHMSWLHCMWGVGASLGPYVMGYALSAGKGWPMGYRYIGVLQIALTVVLVLSLPLWNRQNGKPDGTQEAGPESGRGERAGRRTESGSGSESGTEPESGLGLETGREPEEKQGKPLALKDILQIPGAREVLIAFFCYCALEQTAGLWASSYLVLHRGMSAETAAGFASLFFVGITLGRGISGFLTIKMNDTQMIRLGEVLILAGIAVILLPFGQGTSLAGLILVGLGCAPVYPSIIHSTPAHFGADRSQAMIGVQMAFAYIGTLVMPPLFGLIANHITVALFPAYLLGILALMFAMYEKLLKKVGRGERG